MKLEHTVKITHFKNSTNPRRRYHYTQVAIEEPGSLERAHDHPESERVDEVDSAEVQHQTMTAFTHLGHHMLAQFRSAYNVKLPRDRGDPPRTLAECPSQLHPRNRI